MAVGTALSPQSHHDRKKTGMKFLFLKLLSFNAFAQDPLGRVYSMAYQAKERMVDKHLPIIKAVVNIDKALKEPATFELVTGGECRIMINPKYALSATDDELAFVISVQYAHCLYKDPHDVISESDAWYRVYRADTFANALFSNVGLKASCLNEPDSPSRPSCARRFAARNGSVPTYRADERSVG